jgi:hypothetical protein
MRYFLALILILALTNATAQELFARKNIFSEYEPAIEKYQIVSEKYTIGEYPLLKLDEKMQLVLARVRNSSNTNRETGPVVPLGRVVTIAKRNNKFLMGFDVTANLGQAQINDWTDSPCKRDDILWKRSVGGQISNVNCVTINHLINYFVNPSGEFQQIAVWAKDEGISFPPTAIRVTFTRYSNGGKRLVYAVDINPEQYGVDRDSTTPWGSNGWYKDYITRDQKKVEFIERLKKWATDVQDRIEIAYDKDPKAFSDMQSIDSYLTPPSTKN